jgi:hypothetical protein
MKKELYNAKAAKDARMSLRCISRAQRKQFQRQNFTAASRWRDAFATSAYPFASFALKRCF